MRALVAVAWRVPLGTWDLLGPGIEPVSPASVGGSLTTVPAGESWAAILGAWSIPFAVTAMGSFCQKLSSTSMDKLFCSHQQFRWQSPPPQILFTEHRLYAYLHIITDYHTRKWIHYDLHRADKDTRDGEIQEFAQVHRVDLGFPFSLSNLKAVSSPTVYLLPGINSASLWNYLQSVVPFELWI